MLVIPEMQKKIDELTEEKEKLKQDILDKEKKERDEKRKIEEDRKEEEGRVLKEKEEWEKRILGIGKCLENHDVDKVEDESNGLYNRYVYVVSISFHILFVFKIHFSKMLVSDDILRWRARQFLVEQAH